MSREARTHHDPFAELDPVNLHQAKKIIKDNFAIRWTTNLISSPGLGKSSAVYQVGEELNYYVLDLRLSSRVPEDLSGLVDFTEINGVRRATYAPMDFWPLEGDPLPVNPATGEEYDGIIVFLDEFNSATLAMLAAAYQIVLDHKVGLHRLHKTVRIVCAGNLLTDNAITVDMGTASQSRMTHVPIKVCNDTWHFWADANNVDNRVKAWLRWKPAYLHAFNPNHTDLTFACPRTWETTSDLCKLWGPGPIDNINRPALSGTISTNMAREFVHFTRVWQDLPKFKDIEANPTGFVISGDPSVRHAIAGLVAENLSVQNISNLMPFVLRMSPEFQVIILRGALGRDPSLLLHPAIDTWASTNRTKLIQNAA